MRFCNYLIILFVTSINLSCAQNETQKKREMSLLRRDSLKLIEYPSGHEKDSVGFLLNEILSKENEIGYKPFELIESIVVPIKNLDEVQDSLGLKFPLDLLEYFKTVYKIEELNPKTQIDILPFTWTLNVSYAYHYNNELKMGLAIHGYPDEISKTLFPIFQNEFGDFYWYELAGKKKGHIYYTNTAGDPSSYIYSSLKEFLDVIMESYNKKIISVDEEGNLIEDINKWSQLNLKMSSEYKSYWTSYINGF